MRQLSEQDLARRERQIREVFESLGLSTETERQRMRNLGTPQVPNSHEETAQGARLLLDLTNTADPIAEPIKSYRNTGPTALT